MIGLEQSRGGKTNRRVSLQTSCLPVVSHGTALRRLGLWRHGACFACLVSLTKNERPKYAKLRFNACFLDNKSSFSFRYNKQLIAQLVGRHENFFNPEIHISLGRHECSGLNKSSCLPPNLAINVYSSWWLCENNRIYLYCQMVTEKSTNPSFTLN